MTTPSGGNRLAIPSSNGLIPGAPLDPHQLPGGVGPIWLYVPFDFTSAGSSGADISDDLLIDEQIGRFGTVQSVWIDNSANPNNLFKITFGFTQQIISIGKNSQGVFPVFGGPMWPLRFTAHVGGAATVLVPVFFGNNFMPPAVWGAGP